MAAVPEGPAVVGRVLDSSFLMLAAVVLAGLLAVQVPAEPPPLTDAQQKACIACHMKLASRPERPEAGSGPSCAACHRAPAPAPDAPTCEACHRN